MEFVLVLVAALIWATIGYYTGLLCYNKGRNRFVGFVLGILFPVLSLAVLWLFLGDSTEVRIRKEREAIAALEDTEGS